MNRWRKIAAPIIARVIAEHSGESSHDVRMALRAAYPFGERAMWPYKVWCDEVRCQLGEKARADGERSYQELVNAGQLEMFGEEAL